MVAVVPLRVDSLGNIIGRTPGCTVIVAVETGDILVMAACTALECNVTSTAEHKHAVALAVGNDSCVTETYVHLVGRTVTFTFDDSLYITPVCTVVLTNTCVKVDTAVTDIGTAVTVVGNSDKVTVLCRCDSRDTIGDTALLCYEDISRRLNNGSFTYNLDGEVRCIRKHIATRCYIECEYGVLVAVLNRYCCSLA